MSPEETILIELVQTIFYIIPYGFGIFSMYISSKFLIKIFKKLI